LVVAVEIFWHELAWPRREGILRTIGEFERDDVSVKVWRLRILFLGLVDDRRRLLIVVVVVVVAVVVVVVVVVVTVDDEETSSGSIEVCGGAEEEDNGGGGEVARPFDVSSVSFSFQIRRDTAQRCICRLDRIAIAVLLLLLLFVDVNLKLSTDGVRFVIVLFCWFCCSVELTVG